MYKFTKGKEMEELEDLFNSGRIKKVCLLDQVTALGIESFNKNGLSVIHLSSGDTYHVSWIEWEETAKLVREGE